MTLASPLEYLSQGDIFSELPFYFIDDNGEQKRVNLKAQLLSNTCDASRDDKIIFAGIWPIEEFERESRNPYVLDAIKNNKNYKIFYIPDYATKEYLIDFSLINCISRTVFNKMITAGSIKKIVSLSQIGYFMFISKLTVFFMRPEDEGINNSRFPDEQENYE